MADVPVRELRNDVSGVLRRVEAGEILTVTVSGRPVAEIRPLARRPRALPWSVLMDDRESWQADPGLLEELAALLPDTTDDLPLP